jgi:hypothetical protein
MGSGAFSASLVEVTAMEDSATHWVKLLLSNWIVLIVLICVLSGVVTSFFKQVRKYVSHRHELEFKRDLVERGLSVEEIERIVAAKSSNTSKDTV